jgi:hypothetical protein
MSAEALSPITHEYALRCTAEQAFGTYTGRIGEWWHPRYTANAATLQDVTIEPRVGGRVYATHSDTGEDEWGEVTVWEPARRVVHTFTLAQDPRYPSEIAVEFLPGGAAGDGQTGCTVRFAHRGWTEANVSEKGKFTEWPVMLDRFAALAESNQ